MAKELAKSPDAGSESGMMIISPSLAKMELPQQAHPVWRSLSASTGRLKSPRHPNSVPIVEKNSKPSPFF